MDSLHVEVIYKKNTLVWTGFKERYKIWNVPMIRLWSTWANTNGKNNVKWFENNVHTDENKTLC